MSGRITAAQAVQGQASLRYVQVSEPGLQEGTAGCMSTPAQWEWEACGALDLHHGKTGTSAAELPAVNQQAIQCLALPALRLVGPGFMSMTGFMPPCLNEDTKSMLCCTP